VRELAHRDHIDPASVHRLTYRAACEVLRPFVDAGVLEPAAAALAASRATHDADAHLMARRMMKARRA
jgi:hypothetical protein